jgi:hypothetical protein
LESAGYGVVGAFSCNNRLLSLAVYPLENNLNLLIRNSNSNGGLNSLATFDGLAPAKPILNWLYVTQRFSQLLENLKITPDQQKDGQTKHSGVSACLNQHYWNFQSETANCVLIGSWGKLSRVRPSRDVDLIFLLPYDVYHRFQAREGNKQSQLLQEVKGVLATKYNRTSSIKADGQVIVVPFNQTPIEIAPGFRCQDGSIIICDTNQGGRYKFSTAEPEANELIASDKKWNGNTRALARLLKQWQREKNVPLKSFQLERLAIEFLESWPYSQYNIFWYDWMIRDFFAFLLGRKNTNIIMPGTREVIWLGSDWQSRVQAAYQHAINACIYEHANCNVLACNEWNEIFGAVVSMTA